MTRDRIAPAYHRRGRLLDALSVALLLALMAALGCVAVLASAPAKAEPSRVAVAYAAEYGGVVCDVLDTPAHHTHNGLMGVLDALADEGLTRDQAAEVVVISVIDICPHNMPLIDSFIDRYSEARSIA